MEDADDRADAPARQVEQVATLERVIANQRAMIEAQRRTIRGLWDIVAAQEESRREEHKARRQEEELRRQDQELMKAQMTSYQILLRQLERARELPEGNGVPEGRRRQRWFGRKN